MTTPILIDCDPGHDDAIAILLALASPELDVRAITTVAGNTTLDKTTANARRVLDLIGAERPVHAGCARPFVRELVTAEEVHGASGLDGPSLDEPSRGADEGHAVDAIASFVDSTPGATLVPVGPLTNVGVFLARYPDLADRIDRIVLMGGSMGSGNVTAAAEFNIYVDPEAAQRVFTSGIPVTMIGLDVTHQALLHPADADRLSRSGRVGRFVSELFGFFWGHEPTGSRLAGAPIHDAVAIAHIIWPDLVQLQRMPVTVDMAEAARGRTSVDSRPRSIGHGTVDVATGIDGGRFTRLLVERLESLDG